MRSGQPCPISQFFLGIRHYRAENLRLQWHPHLINQFHFPGCGWKKKKNLQKSLLSWWKNTLSSPVNICAFYKPVITISCWKLSKFFLLGETEANYIDGIWLIFKEDMWTSLQRVQLTYNNSYGKNNQQYSRAFRLVNIIEVGFL